MRSPESSDIRRQMTVPEPEHHAERNLTPLAQVFSPKPSSESTGPSPGTGPYRPICRFRAEVRRRHARGHAHRGANAPARAQRAWFRPPDAISDFQRVAGTERILTWPARRWFERRSGSGSASLGSTSGSKQTEAESLRSAGLWFGGSMGRGWAFGRLAPGVLGLVAGHSIPTTTTLVFGSGTATIAPPPTAKPLTQFSAFSFAGVHSQSSFSTANRHCNVRPELLHQESRRHATTQRGRSALRPRPVPTPLTGSAWRACARSRALHQTF
jgi:hypothetical protein